MSGKLKPYFESKRYKFKDMKPEVFTKYFVFLSQHGKSNGKGGLGYKTVKNIRGVLSSAYEYALENRYVNENPVLRSRMPSFPHSIKKRAREPYLHIPASCPLYRAEKGRIARPDVG